MRPETHQSRAWEEINVGKLKTGRRKPERRPKGLSDDNSRQRDTLSLFKMLSKVKHIDEQWKPNRHQIKKAKGQKKLKHLSGCVKSHAATHPLRLTGFNSMTAAQTRVHTKRALGTNGKLRCLYSNVLAA